MNTPWKEWDRIKSSRSKKSSLANSQRRSSRRCSSSQPNEQERHQPVSKSPQIDKGFSAGSSGSVVQHRPKPRLQRLHSPRVLRSPMNWLRTIMHIECRPPVVQHRLEDRTIMHIECRPPVVQHQLERTKHRRRPRYTSACMLCYGRTIMHIECRPRYTYACML